MRYAPLVTVLLFVLAGCLNGDGDGRESFGDKAEWSILQGVDVESRRTVPATPEFRTVNGYELMSIASRNGSQRIWIMLWPKSPPYYKQMPMADFKLSKELLRELGRQHRVSSTVEEALESHTDPERN